MTESHVAIRESLLTTLCFLASEAEQRDFASKVYYDSYSGEFACWWFDTFFPEEADALQMFTAKQLEMLKSFSKLFDEELDELGKNDRSIDQLQVSKPWQAIVEAAKTAIARLHSEQG